jgi:hypothetical protein
VAHDNRQASPASGRWRGILRRSIERRSPPSKSVALRRFSEAGSLGKLGERRRKASLSTHSALPSGVNARAGLGSTFCVLGGRGGDWCEGRTDVETMMREWAGRSMLIALRRRIVDGCCGLCWAAYWRQVVSL